MRLNVLRANPAGNITLFVLDPVEPEQRADIAARLIDRPELKAEQVGFLCPACQGGDGRMEMMGGEFCGNATRAFGMLLSKRMDGKTQVRVETSGCERIVTVDVDLSAGTARTEMPLPQWIAQRAVAGREGILVNLGGIAHLVVEDITPSEEFFHLAEPLFQDISGLDAYGVIFLDGKKGHMTPLVKVPATGTLIWEGSCGSGSLAAAAAQSIDGPDGIFARDYIQPAGIVRAEVAHKNGLVTAASIGGPVTLEPPIELEL